MRGPDSLDSPEGESGFALRVEFGSAQIELFGRRAQVDVVSDSILSGDKGGPDSLVFGVLSLALFVALDVGVFDIESGCLLAHFWAEIWITVLLYLAFEAEPIQQLQKAFAGPDGLGQLLVEDFFAERVEENLAKLLETLFMDVVKVC